MITDPRPTVAVVGSGVAGLTAAHLLQRRYDVHLFEADERLGGHAHTHDVALTSGRVAGLDTALPGAQHPHLPHAAAAVRRAGRRHAGLRDVDERPVRRLRAGVRRRQGPARPGPAGVGADSSALPRDAGAGDVGFIAAPGRCSRAWTTTSRLGEFLRRERFGRYSRTTSCCHWSRPSGPAGSTVPARIPPATSSSSCDHHGALAVTGSPQWRTVSGGSRTYVERIAKQLSARAHRDAGSGGHAARGRGRDPRRRRRRPHGRPRRRRHSPGSGAAAAHATPRPDERRLLGAFRYLPSEAILHTDGSVLPRRRAGPRVVELPHGELRLR